MAVLARSVHVKDPRRPGRTILLSPGEEPALELAVQVLNPLAWEGGKVPAAVRRHLAAQKDSKNAPDPGGQGNDDTDPESDNGSETESGDAEPQLPDHQPAAAKKTAARKPAARRTAAAEGTGGQ